MGQCFSGKKKEYTPCVLCKAQGCKKQHGYQDIAGCHNCFTWGPRGCGDNPWYERNACKGCKNRLLSGEFKASDKSPKAGGLIAKAEEMITKLGGPVGAAKAQEEEQKRKEEERKRKEAEARKKAAAKAEAKRKAEAEAKAARQAEAEERAKARAEAEKRAGAEAAAAQDRARKQEEEWRRKEEESRKEAGRRRTDRLSVPAVRVPAGALRNLRKPKMLGLSTATVRKVAKAGCWAARIGEAIPLVGGCIKVLGKACEAVAEHAEQKEEYCNKLLYLETRLDVLENVGLANVGHFLSKPEVAQRLWTSGVKTVFVRISKLFKVFEGAVADASDFKTDASTLVSARLQSLISAVEEAEEDAGMVEDSESAEEEEAEGVEYEGSLSPEDVQRLTSDAEFCFQALHMCVSSTHLLLAVDSSPKADERHKVEIRSQLSEAATALNEGNTSVGNVMNQLSRYRIRVIDEGDLSGTEQELGAGASGVVLLKTYLCKFQVAVKVSTGGQGSISRTVLTESYLNGKLSSDPTRPVIVPYMYGVFLHGREVGIVSEVASFGALHTILYKRRAKVVTNGQLSDQKVDAEWIKARQLGWLRDTARALHILHTEYGITHCDVKAANMLLFGDEGRQVKVGDLGCSYVARDNRTLSQAGNTIGAGFTLKYRAPERADESVAAGGTTKPAPAVDVYSFGMLGFEVMYGCEAWAGKRDVDIEKAISGRKGLMQKLRGKEASTRFPDPPSQLLLGSVPNAEVLRLLSDCCRTNPEKRPTMKDAAQMLADKLAGAQ